MRKRFESPLFFGVILLLCATFAQGQYYVRWDIGQPGSAGAVTVSGNQLFSVPGVALNFCYSPANAVPCTNFAPTFNATAANALACSSGSPIVLQGSSTCVGTGDNFGNLGVWTLPGTYAYTLTVNGVSSGPYTISIAGPAATVYATAGETVAHAAARLPASGGTIVFAPGTYSSGNYTCTTANVALQGSGMPSYNSQTAPTALTGGTIIQGQVAAQQGCDRFVVKDLGIDVGPNWVNNVNGGQATGGLVIFNNGQIVGPSQVQSPIIANVSCLGYSPSAAFHCMLVENVNDASITNIATTYNVYGLAFKGTNSKISGVWARSHGTNGIIIKADTYAPANNVNLSNFNIGTLAPGDLYGGLYLAAIGNQLSYINVSNGVIQNPSQFGIFLQGGATTPAVSEINITGVTIDSALELGADCYLFTGYVQYVNITGTHCSNAANGEHISSPATGLLNHINTANSTFEFLSGDGIQTYDYANVTGVSFHTITGAAVKNTAASPYPAVSSLTLVGVGSPYSGNVQTDPMRASLTTTAAATDNVTIPGMTSTGRCTLTPTNVGAAGGMAATFISAKTTDQITVTHTATANWTFDILCTPY